MKAPDANDIVRDGGTEALRAALDHSISASQFAGNGHDRASAPEPAASQLVRTLSDFLASFTPPDYLVDGLLLRGFLYSLTRRRA
jgi:hypothetical protein